MRLYDWAEAGMGKRNEWRGSEEKRGKVKQKGRKGNAGVRKELVGWFLGCTDGSQLVDIV